MKAQEIIDYAEKTLGHKLFKGQKQMLEILANNDGKTIRIATNRRPYGMTTMARIYFDYLEHKK